MTNLAKNHCSMKKKHKVKRFRGITENTTLLFKTHTVYKKNWDLL